MEVLRFWMRRGIDGFRVDAVHYLFEDETLPDNPVNPSWREGDNPTWRFLPAHNADLPEMIGAVRGRDPNTGEYFDDTKRYVDACDFLTDADRAKIYEGNARRVYPRLDARLQAQGR